MRWTRVALLSSSLLLLAGAPRAAMTEAEFADRQTLLANAPESFRLDQGPDDAVWSSLEWLNPRSGKPERVEMVRFIDRAGMDHITEIYAVGARLKGMIYSVSFFGPAIPRMILVADDSGKLVQVGGDGKAIPSTQEGALSEDVLEKAKAELQQKLEQVLIHFGIQTNQGLRERLEKSVR